MEDGRIAAARAQIESELRAVADRYLAGSMSRADIAAEVAEQARRKGLPVVSARLVGDCVALDYVEPMGEG